MLLCPLKKTITPTEVSVPSFPLGNPLDRTTHNNHPPTNQVQNVLAKATFAADFYMVAGDYNADGSYFDEEPGALKSRGLAAWVEVMKNQWIRNRGDTFKHGYMFVPGAF